MACQTDCDWICAGTCQSGCTTTCANNCRGTCSGDCDSTCTGDCEGTCSGTCSGGCKSGCRGGCKGDCEGCTACTGTCSGACDAGCSTEANASLNNQLNNLDIAVGKYMYLADYNTVASSVINELQRRGLTGNVSTLSDNTPIVLEQINSLHAALRDMSKNSPDVTEQSLCSAEDMNSIIASVKELYAANLKT